MSAIVDALKTEYSARLTIGDRWLVWDEFSELWVVYGRSYGQRKTRVHARTEDEAEAISVLAADDRGG